MALDLYEYEVIVKKSKDESLCKKELHADGTCWSYMLTF